MVHNKTITELTGMEIGDWVKRRGNGTDRSHGRTGQIVEFDDKRMRVRVKWVYERGGEPIRKINHVGEIVPTPVRTWVSYNQLLTSY